MRPDFADFFVYFTAALVPISAVILFILLLTIERNKQKQELEIEKAWKKKVDAMIAGESGPREAAPGRAVTGRIDRELEDIRSKLVEREESARSGGRAAELQKDSLEKTDPATLGKMLTTMIKNR